MFETSLYPNKPKNSYFLKKNVTQGGPGGGGLRSKKSTKKVLRIN
jgi:hypothetical protein